MRLDVYRSCSRGEKRDVLNAYWRSSTQPTPRIKEAALQYGPYAIVCLAIVVLEVVPLLIVSIARGFAWSWIVGGFEALNLLSLWWAVVRLRALKSLPESPTAIVA